MADKGGLHNHTLRMRVLGSLLAQLALLYPKFSGTVLLRKEWLCLATAFFYHFPNFHSYCPFLMLLLFFSFCGSLSRFNIIVKKINK